MSCDNCEILIEQRALLLEAHRLLLDGLRDHKEPAIRSLVARAEPVVEHIIAQDPYHAERIAEMRAEAR